ncbi:MAG: hypothetical protein ACU0CO_06250, partial [Shimia sp.]
MQVVSMDATVARGAGLRKGGGAGQKTAMGTTKITARDGTALHVREDGDPAGAPLVLANGLGTHLAMWDGVVAALPPGLRIVRYDMR